MADDFRACDSRAGEPCDHFRLIRTDTEDRHLHQSFDHIDTLFMPGHDRQSALSCPGKERFIQQTVRPLPRALPAGMDDFGAALIGNRKRIRAHPDQDGHGIGTAASDQFGCIVRRVCANDHPLDPLGQKLRDGQRGRLAFLGIQIDARAKTGCKPGNLREQGGFTARLGGQSLQPGGGHVGNLEVKSADCLEVFIVKGNRDPVHGQPNINFPHVRPKLMGDFICPQRVVEGIGAGTSVGDGKRNGSRFAEPGAARLESLQCRFHQSLPPSGPKARMRSSAMPQVTSSPSL